MNLQSFGAAHANLPCVSIVMTFRDEARFIEEAVSSVFAQTLPGWELLLIDDGSTDASTSIARGHATRHPDRVRYFEHARHENRGTSVSRNLGIRHARAPYLAFLDADDVWLPRKLETQVRLLTMHRDAVMVYGPTQRWFSWAGDRARADDMLDVGVPPGTLLDGETFVARTVSRQIHSPCTCSMLVRREAAEAAGGFENGFRDMYDDQVFTSKVVLHASVLVDGDCSSRYRRHADSCYAVAKATGTWRGARIAYLRWLLSYLAGQGLEGSDVWKVARAEYRAAVRSLPDRSLVERAGRLAGRVVGRAVRIGRQLVPGSARQASGQGGGSTGNRV